MVDNVQQNGRVTTVFYSSRQPKTRAAIHMHDYAGVTCIVQGEMTLYLEGRSPIKKVAGECYYMPSGLRMTAYNSGDKIAVFYDFFNFSEGGAALRVVEGVGCDSRQGKMMDVCSDNLYIIHH